MLRTLALVGMAVLPLGMQAEPAPPVPPVPPAPPALASPSIAALRQRISAEAERQKAALQAQETGADYTLLLRRKFTVDCTLAPLLLQEDASAFVAAVAAGREPPDLLRLLRAEFADEPPESQWSHAGAAMHIARALQSWAAPAGGATAWRVSAAVLEGTVSDTPPYIWWTGRAEGGAHWPGVEAKAWWYEPCADTRRLDWPLSPWHLNVKWNAHSGAIGGDDGVRHSEAWPQAPRFNNPNDMYALFDLLRARTCKDLGAGAVRATPQLPVESAANAVIGADNPPKTLSRVFTRRDGTILRREEWRFDGRRLRELRIEQPPLRVRHHFSHVFELAQEVDGAPIAPVQEIAPASELKYPAMGMSISIMFRTPDVARDALAPEYMHDDAASVPEAIVIESNGGLAARCEYGGMASGVGEGGHARVARALRIWNEAAASGAATRAAAMSLAESASAHGDLAGIRMALGDTKAICSADGVPADWHVLNIEVCIRLLTEAGHTAQAWELASVDWLNAMTALESGARVRHAERAAVFGPAAVVRVALGPLSHTDDDLRGAVHSALDRAMHMDAANVPRSLDQSADCAPPCSRPADGTPEARLLDAIQAALTGSARDERQLERRAIAPLVISACNAVAQSPLSSAVRPDAPNSELLIARAAQDLGAVIATGTGEFAASSHQSGGDLCAFCARFEMRVRGALACTLPTDREREEFRRNIRALGDVANAEVERLARERGIPAADAAAAGATAALAIRDFSALAGNAFHPELLRGPPAGALDAHAMAAALRASPELRTALCALDLHVARRSAGTGGASGGSGGSGSSPITPRMHAEEIARATSRVLQMLIQEKCSRTNRVGRPA